GRRWSRNVIARSEFSHFAEIPPGPVLSYLPFGGARRSGTQGVDRVGKHKGAGLTGRLSMPTVPKAGPRQTAIPHQFRSGPRPVYEHAQIPVSVPERDWDS